MGERQFVVDEFLYSITASCVSLALFFDKYLCIVYNHLEAVLNEFPGELDSGKLLQIMSLCFYVIT